MGTSIACPVRAHGRWRSAKIAPGLAAAVLVAAACAAGGTASSGTGGSGGVTASSADAPAPPARLVFVGDVMLGRQVGTVAAVDPGSIFEQLRPTLAGADLALANLESPLTTRAHTAEGFALEADPAVAPLLASAGIDVVDLANNHATDAGPATVLDTLAATSSAGVRGVGAGVNRAAAAAPLVVDVDGLRVGV
ncbi:MAG: CapA family protein, partial [Ilumatobacteraceae bacterium]